MTSLPSWERGLKSIVSDRHTVDTTVAPLVGAWIEIMTPRECLRSSGVAPLVGAWIEISIDHRKIRYRKGRSPRGSVD